MIEGVEELALSQARYICNELIESALNEIRYNPNHEYVQGYIAGLNRAITSLRKMMTKEGREEVLKKEESRIVKLVLAVEKLRMINEEVRGELNEIAQELESEQKNATKNNESDINKDNNRT